MLSRALPWATVLLVAAGVVVAPPAFAAAPTITSFTPTSGVAATTVTVTGSGFAAPVTVKFGGVAAPTPTVVSSTKITAKVPGTAATGKISVTTAGGTATSSGSFTVVPSLRTTPTVGPPTTTATLAISGLRASEAVDVYFDTTAVRLAVASGTGSVSTALPVPQSATPGAHWFTAVGRTSGTAVQAKFTVRTNATMEGFGVSRSGSNPYENVLTPATIGKVTQQWRVDVGGSVQATPAVVDGVVYVGAGDGSVRALSADTGAQKWLRQTGGGTTFSSPAVVGSTVYIGSGDHKLYALSTTTGGVRWQATVGDLVYSSPVVVGNTVYVGSYDKSVYAFNAATGALRWSFATGAAVFGSPSVVDGVVYVGSFDSNVYALNATTGAMLWQKALAGLVLAPTIVEDGYVYAASEGKDVVAIERATGVGRWSTTVGGVVDALAYADGRVVVSDTSGTVRALEAADGSLAWSTTISGGPTLRSTIAVAAGVVYVQAAGSTYAYALSDGARLRTLAIGSSYGGLAVNDGAITVGDAVTDVVARYALPGVTGAARPQPASLHP